MFNNRKTSFIVTTTLMLAAVPVSSFAGPASQITGIVSAGSLAQTESRIAMLKMQLEIAKLNAGIAKANDQAKHPGARKASLPASGYGNAPMFPSATAVNPSPSPTPSATHPAAPRVLSLSGAGGHYQATLALPDGEVMTVVNGSRLGHGWRVRGISATGVTATHAGRVIPLGFASGNGSTSGSASEQAGEPTGFAPPPMAAPMSGAGMPFGPPPSPKG